MRYPKMKVATPTNTKTTDKCKKSQKKKEKMGKLKRQLKFLERNVQGVRTKL